MQQTDSILLVIDVGNTNIVYGLFRGTELLMQFRVESGRSRTADEYLVTLLQLLQTRDVRREDVKHAIVASVVPALTDPMVHLVQRGFGVTAAVVGPGIRTGMPILYENPKEVGADRIVNAVASGTGSGALDPAQVEQVCSAEDIIVLQKTAAAVQCRPDVTAYAVRIVRATREMQGLSLGAGTRGGISTRPVRTHGEADL